MNFVRYFLIFCFLIPLGATGKQLTLTMNPTYPLTPNNVQLICEALHASLSTESSIKLNALSDTPFQCFKESSQNQLKIIVTLT